MSSVDLRPPGNAATFGISFTHFSVQLLLFVFCAKLQTAALLAVLGSELKPLDPGPRPGSEQMKAENKSIQTCP